MNAESPGASIFGQLEDVRTRVEFLLEGAAGIADAHRHPVVFDNDRKVDLLRVIAPVGMFDDVRARFIDGDLELLDRLLGESRIPNVHFHEATNPLQVASRARNTQRMYGLSHGSE